MSTPSRDQDHHVMVLIGHPAAIKAGVESLAYLRDFADEDEALLYAIASQRDRRNLTDAELVRCVEALDDLKSEGGRPRKTGAIAPVFGKKGNPGGKGCPGRSAAS